MEMNAKEKELAMAYICPKCEKTYQSSQTLMRHFKSHLPGYVKKSQTAEHPPVKHFSCDICKKSYAFKTSLWRHTQSHFISLTYSCSGCGKSFLSYSTQYQHRKNCEKYIKLQEKKKSKALDGKRWIETTEEYLSVYQHKCQMCEQRFAIREDLDSHINHCGDPLWSANLTQLHLPVLPVAKLLKKETEKLQIIHRRKRLILETVKKFGTKRNKPFGKITDIFKIANRTKQLRKIFPATATRISAASALKRSQNLSRKVCAKTMKEKQMLTKQIRVTTDRKLLKHFKMFKGVDHYKCNLCFLTFKTVSAIMHHLRYVPRPLVCRVCLKAFTSVSSFNFHQIRTLHGIKPDIFSLGYASISYRTVNKTFVVKGFSSGQRKEKGGIDKVLVGQYESKCLCGQIFIKRESLADHVISWHGMMLAFSCSHCQNIYDNFCDLFTHIQSKHNKERLQRSDFEHKLLIPKSNAAGRDNEYIAQHMLDAKLVKGTTISIKTEDSKPGVIGLKQSKDKNKRKGKIQHSVLSKKTGNMRKNGRPKQEKELQQSILERNQMTSAKSKNDVVKTKIMEKHQMSSAAFRAKMIVRKYKAVLRRKYKKYTKQDKRVLVSQRQRTKKKINIISKQYYQSEYKYKCNFCQKVLRSCQMAVGHLFRVHKKNTVFECSVCHKIFGGLMNFKLHCLQHPCVNVKTQIPINLLFTAQVSSDQKASRVDMSIKIAERIRHQKGKYSGKCKLCGKVYQWRKSLTQHVKAGHNMILGYKCKLCHEKVAFEKFQQLCDHIKYSHRKVYFSERDFEQTYKELDTESLCLQTDYINKSRGKSRRKNLKKLETGIKASITVSRRYDTASVKGKQISKILPEGVSDLGSHNKVKTSRVEDSVLERGKRHIKLKLDSAFEYDCVPTALTKTRRFNTSHSLNYPESSFRDIKYKNNNGNGVKTVVKPDSHETGGDKQYCCKYCRRKYRYEVMLQRHMEGWHRQELLKEEETKTNILEVNSKAQICGRKKSKQQRKKKQKDNDKNEAKKAPSDRKAIAEFLSESKNNARVMVRDISNLIENTGAVEVMALNKNILLGDQENETKQNRNKEAGNPDEDFKSQTSGQFYEEMKKGDDHDHEMSSCSGDSYQSDLGDTVGSADEFNQASKTDKQETSRNVEMETEKIGLDIYYICSFKNCSKFFQTKKSLAYHKKKFHGKNLLYVCGICQTNTFTDIGSLRIHITARHSSLKRFPLMLADTEICTQENKPTEIQVCCKCCATGNKKELDRHFCQLKMSKYYCPFCSLKKSSFEYEEIRNHIEQEHQRKRMVRDKVGISQTISDDYRPSNTVVEDDAHADDLNTAAREADKSSLDQKSQTALFYTYSPKFQPYVCGLCRTPYTQYSALKRHALVHQGYSYKCHPGNGDFIEQSNLDCQMNTHMENKLYQCSFCGNRYCDDHACENHMKKKHTEKFKTAKKEVINKDDAFIETDIAGAEISAVDSGDILLNSNQEADIGRVTYDNTDKGDEQGGNDNEIQHQEFDLDDTSGNSDTENHREKEVSEKEKKKPKNTFYREITRTSNVFSAEDTCTGIDLLYMCTVEKCNEIFKHKKKLHHHKKEKHGSGLVYSCSICRKVYTVIRSFKVHISWAHTDLKTVPLKLVDTEFFTKNRTPTEMLVCTICGLTKGTEEIDRHICQPRMSVYYCPFCKLKTSSDCNEEIRNHIKQEHSSDEGKSMKKGPGLSTTEDSGASNSGMGRRQVDDQIVAEDGGDMQTASQRESVVQEVATCSHCDKQFESVFDRNIHENEHKGQKLQEYVCGCCGYSYPRYSALRKHIVAHLQYSYKCHLCDREFPEQCDLDRHLNTHTGNRPYQCDICGNRYCDDKACKRHIKEKHPDVYFERFRVTNKRSAEDQQQSFCCELCGEVINNQQQWNYHMDHKHSNKHNQKKKKMFTCDTCPEQNFRTKALFQQHVKEHQHKKLLQLAADKGQKIEEKEMVKSDPKLELHETVKATAKDPVALKAVYEQLKMYDKFDRDGLPIKCRICSRKFRSVKHFNLHIRRSHVSDENKKFRCNECGKGFPVISNLKSHIRVHTNSRPYICKLCPKAFKQIGHVKDHLLSHSSKFLNICKLCGKQFKMNGSIKPHVLTHCKLKPFKCPICTDTFQDMSQLINHFSKYVHDELDGNNSTKTFRCHMCRDFQSETKHEMIKHIENHSYDNPFKCETCDEAFSKFVSLYFHKVKFNHFIETDFDTTKKFNNPYLTNIGKTEIYDDYDLEELQSMYLYRPDRSEPSKSDLEDMINPDGIENYEEEEYLNMERKKKSSEAKDVRRSMDTREMEFREMNSVVYSAPGAGIEYEDLLSVAQQLTHMADIEHTGYTEVVVSDNLENESENIMNDTNKTYNPNIENNPEIMTQPLSVENDLGMNSQWNTDFILKSQGQNDTAYQSQYKTVPTQPSGEIQEEIIYTNNRNEETFSAANTIIDQNHMKSLLPQNIDVLNTNDKEIVIKINGQPNTPTKSVVKQYFKMEDQSGNEVFVCILNESSENSDILNINQKAESDGIPEIGELIIDSILNNKGTETNKKSDAVLSEIEADMNKDTNILPVSMNDGKKDLKSFGENGTEIISKDKAVELQTTDTEVQSIFEKECFYMLDETEQKKRKFPDYDEDADDIENIRSCRTKFMNKKNEDTGNFPCEICGKRFTKVKLKNYHRKVHLPDNEREYQCDQCGRGFNRPCHLETHKRLHSGTKLFSCSICDRRFTQLGHLTTHKLVHSNTRPFKCDQCDWTGTTRSNLRKHVLLKHEGERKWKCVICDKAYVTKGDLKRHSVIHLSKTARSEIIAKTSKDAIQKTDLDSEVTAKQRKAKSHIPKFVCDICGAGYMQLKSLNLHYMKHQSGDTYKCKVCSKGFPTELVLKKHEKVHAETQIPCDRCGKMFKNKASLRYHISVLHEQTHKANYQCVKCQRGFRKQTHFLCHVAVCRPKLVDEKF